MFTKDVADLLDVVDVAKTFVNASDRRKLYFDHLDGRLEIYMCLNCQHGMCLPDFSCVISLVYT